MLAERITRRIWETLYSNVYVFPVFNASNRVLGEWARTVFRSRKDTAVFLPRGRIHRLVHARFCKTPRWISGTGISRVTSRYICSRYPNFGYDLRSSEGSEAAAGEASKETWLAPAVFRIETARFKLIEVRNGASFEAKSNNFPLWWKRCQGFRFERRSVVRRTIQGHIQRWEKVFKIWTKEMEIRFTGESRYGNWRYTLFAWLRIFVTKLIFASSFEGTLRNCWEWFSPEIEGIISLEQGRTSRNILHGDIKLSFFLYTEC